MVTGVVLLNPDGRLCQDFGPDVLVPPRRAPATDLRLPVDVSVGRAQGQADRPDEVVTGNGGVQFEQGVVVSDGMADGVPVLRVDDRLDDPVNLLLGL